MDDFHSKLATSRLRMHTHAFGITILVMVYALACTFFNFNSLMVPLITVLVVTTKFDEEKLVIPITLVSLVFGTYNPSWFLPFYLLVVGIDQQSFTKQFNKTAFLIKWILLKLGDVSLVLTRPGFGTNSSFLEVVHSKFQYFLNELVEMRSESLGFASRMADMTTTYATYIRPNGITDTPLSIEHVELIEPATIAEKYHRAAEQYRGLIILVIFLVAFSISGISSAVAIVLVIFIWLMQKPLSSVTQVRLSNRGPPLKDGIYSISTTGLIPILSTEGIGVVYNKVLHVPYHVSNANPISVNGVLLFPYYVSIERDLVTYGNGPQIMTPRENMDVYVNTEEVGARSTYSVGDCYKYSHGTLVIPSVTEPGHSGSPIYGRDRDTGTLFLLGLAGRFVGDYGCRPSEFHQTPMEINSNGRVEYVLEHPGFGKTRRIVPEKIKESLLMHPNQKILVTGPTRIVCKELFDSLNKIGGITVTLNIKGSEHRRSRANVEIAAHRTALKMLSTEDVNLKFYSTIIIDEAHQEDAATILLRKFVRNIPDIRVIEMSATLDGVYNNASNYHISDVRIPKGNIIPLAHQLLSDGKRVLVFVTSIKSKETEALVKSLSEYNPIILSRATLEKNRIHLDDLERRLVISTDISEIGINVKDLDCVIDPREKFTYTVNAGIVAPHRKSISRSSMIQRRGRVGRTKTGTYYYVDLPFDEEETVAHFDADVLAYGRSWGSVDKLLPFGLTDRQFLKWLDADLTPFMVYFKYDQLGNLRGEAERMQMWETMTGKGNLYSGCKNPKCKCAGKYDFLDLRDHDVLFGYSTR